MIRHRRKAAGKKASQTAKTPPAAEGPLEAAVGVVRRDFRQLMVDGGLMVMKALLEEDLEALCGPRHMPDKSCDERVYRWGSQRGVVVMGGQKTTVSRPRVRRGGHEVPIPTYEVLQGRDPLDERTLEQMVIGVSTRKYHRSLETPAPRMDVRSVGRSSVSRRFVVATRAQLQEALAAPLGDRRWVAVLLDGVAFANHVVIIALGIDETGHKRVLGLRQGSTENTTVCRELLSNLIERGLPADRSLLAVIDGGKGLRKAVGEVFGPHALVQRCQVHKRRNVLDHLPEQERAQVGHVLSQAYAPSTRAATATKQLENLAKALEHRHPSAASSLREGLLETLTVKEFGLSDDLSKCLATTNAIENLNGTIRRVSGRVRRWSSGDMVLRWVATSVLEAASGFRRLRGYKSMPRLLQVLNEHERLLRGDKKRLVG